MLATIVGSANGRSMSAFTKPLPGKSSRTRTQAISVPMTTLTRATTTETTTVTRSAASAIGSVTAPQKPDQPSSNALTVSAASGSRTITLSQSMAVAMASGPTEPVNRSQDRSGRRGDLSWSTEPAGAGSVAGLRTVTSIEYRVWAGSPGYSVAFS